MNSLPYSLALCQPPLTFQRLMDEVFYGLHELAVDYVDDVLHSSTWETPQAFKHSI